MKIISVCTTPQFVPSQLLSVHLERNSWLYTDISWLQLCSGEFFVDTFVSGLEVAVRALSASLPCCCPCSNSNTSFALIIPMAGQGWGH